MTTVIFRLATVLLLLLLTGCVGTDPYSLIAAGQAAIEATSAARQVSAAETQGAVSAAVLEATRYAGEVMAVEAQVRGTEAAVAYEQTAVAVQATRSAGDLQATAARATSQIVEMQATQAYLVQYASGMSTATAIINERELQATARAGEYKRARSWRNLGLAFGWGIFLFLVAMGGTLVYAMAINAKARAIEKVAHAQYLYGRTIDQQAVQQLPDSLPDAPDDNSRTLNFLVRAAHVAPLRRDAHQLPSDDLMHWSSGPWTKEVKRLVKAGAVYVRSGKGSYIKDPYRTIEGLYQAIVSGSLKLPPYPTPEEYRYLVGNAPETETETETEEYYA